MKGDAQPLIKFFDGSDKRFIIPHTISEKISVELHIVTKPLSGNMDYHKIN